MTAILRWVSLCALLPCCAWAWSGPIVSPELGFPKGTSETTMKRVLEFLRTEVKFIEGRFLNEYSWQQYQGTPAKVSQLMRLLHEPGGFEVKVVFNDLKDKKVSFHLNQTSKQPGEVTVVINTGNPDFRLSELEIQIPSAHGQLEHVLDPLAK